MHASMGVMHPHCQSLHVQSSSDDTRLLTTLTTPCRAHQGQWTTARPRKGMMRSRGRRGSGWTHGEEYEGSLVQLRREATVAAGPG